MLQLQLGSSTVDFASERKELWTAIHHIYRAFLTDPESTSASGSGSPELPGSVSDMSPWRASVNGELFELDEFEWALRSVEDTIADRLLEAYADCLLLHAGAVSRDDTTYLVVGKSGSGKTTTTLEFLRRGFLYLTDEFTAIEPDGATIRPFPRSATRKFNSLIPAGSALQVSEEQGYRSHMLPDNRALLQPRAMNSCRIIFPTHDGEVTPQARLLDSAELCARLMPSIFDFEGNEKTLWPALSSLVTNAQACELDYNNAKTDLDIALNLFD